MIPKRVERQFTYVGYLNFGLIAFIPLLFMSFAVGTSTHVLPWLVLALVYLIFVIPVLLHRHAVQSFLSQRSEQLMALAAEHNWTYDHQPATVDELSLSSMKELPKREYDFTDYIKSPDWSYATFSYAIYRRSKGGDYKEQSLYYAMMAAELPRELPNIVFDSLRSRGRQFRKLFDKSQLHRLEGDFNEYFNTYFAPTYTIDSLSFISPEVMLALEDAAAYDIEIVGNHVLLYGPLEATEAQLHDMAAKLAVIKDKLLNNILTYNDDRLPNGLGRERVTPLGMSLKRKPVIYWSAIIAVIYIIIWFVLNIVKAH